MKKTKSLYRKLANCIRAITIDAIEKAKSGHPGMPLGMADVATVLYSDFLEFNPQDPKWLNRDRLVFSAGHGSMLLYSLLYLTGYKDITLDDIKNFRQLSSKTQGHPEFGTLEGVEVTTGPLGQGIANAVGMALAAKMTNARVNGEILDHKVYIIAGDGCIMEGISHEAASLAGHLQLNNIILLYDDNGITIDGKKDIADSEDVLARFKAYNWEVYKIDGHNYQEIHDVIEKAQDSDKPVLIACKTTIGYGAPNKGGTEKCHGSPLGEQEMLLAKKKYGWNTEEPFFILDDLMKIWREEIGKKSIDYYKEWNELVNTLNSEQREMIKYLNSPKNYSDEIDNLANKLKQNITEGHKATRVSSGDFIEAINGSIPLCGGSADLTGSNCSKAKWMNTIKPMDYLGNYIHYGIREHAMAAIMNGICVYGHKYLYGSTFLVFIDYMRPAIRMAALMKLPVIYVMTHDSIGVGEDGATHQPIEQIASFRAMPNINVFRPADETETIECWQLALNSESTPSVLCLTRQGVPKVRTEYVKENLSQKGGYILSDSKSQPDVVILATGSEVFIALEVKELLKNKLEIRVVSVPCFDLLSQQSQSYIDSLIPKSSTKIVIEAATRFGWERFVGNEGMFFCIDTFGKSAPAEELFKHFGLNADTISKKILNKVEGK